MKVFNWSFLTGSEVWSIVIMTGSVLHTGRRDGKIAESSPSGFIGSRKIQWQALVLASALETSKPTLHPVIHFL